MTKPNWRTAEQFPEFGDTIFAEDGHPLPCKKHGCLPSLRVVPLCDTFGQSLKWTRQEYFCKQCEQETLDRSFQGIVDAWNKKQIAAA